MNSVNTCYTPRQVALLNELHLLWMQHVHWARSFIISTAANSGDLEPVTNRLLGNPGDFAELFSLFYKESPPHLRSAESDDQTVGTFQKLFTQHLLIAADLVNAIKINDQEAADEARRKWYKNADEIASFLAGINPYWDEQTWRDFLYSHLQMTEEEATLRLAGNYAEDVKIHDQIEREAVDMADYMFYGFLNYFQFH